MNKLEIRRRDSNDGPMYGGLVDVFLNGNKITGWTRIAIDIKPDEFIVADVTVAVAELEVDNEVWFELIGIVQEGGRVTVRTSREGKVQFAATMDVPEGRETSGGTGTDEEL